MKTVYLYTDGACSGNPGPGGYGAILKYGQHVKEICGGDENTTTNRLELLGVIKGMEALNEPCHVVLTSDSKYVIDALTLGWAEKWKQNGWMRNKKDAALNPDLWEQLLNLTSTHEMEYNWVKGHAGHPENERCDKMAVEYYQKFIK